MRRFVSAYALSLIALAALAVSPVPATAEKSRMGCDTATEVWDAGLGKCQPGTPKYKRRSTEPTKEPAAKATAAAKKAPAGKKTSAPKKAPAANKGPDAAK